MNYQRIYNQLIARAQSRKFDGYVERHHVIPKCLGGSDDSKNIVELTPEEHYVAHQLLVKMYPTSEQLLYAARMMTVEGSGQTRNNKEYGWLKKRYNKICRSRIGKKNPSYGRSWYHNPETTQAGKFLVEDVPVGWVKGRTSRTKQRVCRKCSIAISIVPSHLSSYAYCTSCKRESRLNKDLENRKIAALIEHNGNIRQALLSLGLNDSGTHYKRMQEILANLPERSKGTVS